MLTEARADLDLPTRSSSSVFVDRTPNRRKLDGGGRPSQERKLDFLLLVAKKRGTLEMNLALRRIHASKQARHPLPSEGETSPGPDRSADRLMLTSKWQEDRDHGRRRIRADSRRASYLRKEEVWAGVCASGSGEAGRRGLLAGVGWRWEGAGEVVVAGG